MIPPNLTCAEVGIFLQAVGLHMEAHDVSFGAALDEHGRDSIKADVELDLVNTMDVDGPGWRQQVEARAAKLMQLTGEEAINFTGVPGCD